MKLSIKDKFNMCFNERIKPSEHINHEFVEKYNKLEFINLLEQSQLKEYSTLLYDYVLSQKQTEIDEEYKVPIGIDINEVIQLTKSLIYLLSNEITKYSISIKSKLLKTETTSMSNQLIVKNTLYALMQTYTELRLNEEHLTYGEARDILTGNGTLDFSRKDHSDENDISKWVRYYLNSSPEVKWGFEYTGERIYLGDQALYCSPEMTVKYAAEHFVKREITIEYLYNKLVQLEIKTGAKPKNDKTAQFAERLSYLIRLDDFLKQTEIANFEKYSIRNKDYKLIYKILVFFEFIKELDNSDNTTTPESYIKALINNYRKNRKKHYVKRKNWYLVEKTIYEFKSSNFLLAYYV